MYKSKHVGGDGLECWAGVYGDMDGFGCVLILFCCRYIYIYLYIFFSRCQGLICLWKMQIKKFFFLKNEIPAVLHLVKQAGKSLFLSLYNAFWVKEMMRTRCLICPLPTHLDGYIW